MSTYALVMALNRHLKRLGVSLQGPVCDGKLYRAAEQGLQHRHLWRGMRDRPCNSLEWREAESNPYKPDGKGWIGGEAIVRHLFMRLATEWDGFTVTPGAFHDAGDTVAVECRYTGTGAAVGDRHRPPRQKKLLGPAGAL
jgi:hypothetical protein